MLLLVGLGNPGPNNNNNRHNIGFKIIDAINNEFSLSKQKPKFKGLLTTGDRTKHLLIKEQYPDLDIRFIFSRPTNKLDKRTKTTYGDWCDRYGFLYSKDRIPREWMMTSKKKKKISKIL